MQIVLSKKNPSKIAFLLVMGYQMTRKKIKTPNLFETLADKITIFAQKTVLETKKSAEIFANRIFFRRWNKGEPAKQNEKYLERGKLEIYVRYQILFGNLRKNRLFSSVVKKPLRIHTYYE